jgi:hypothetical protein
LKRLPGVLLLLGAAAAAGEPGYRLTLDAAVEGAALVVAPKIAAPAGSRLRYQIVSTKEGAAGRSSTSQSGTVALDAGGSGRLATLALGVQPSDRYTVTVKVFDGAKLVAEDVLRYPQ